MGKPIKLPSRAKFGWFNPIFHWFNQFGSFDQVTTKIVQNSTKILHKLKCFLDLQRKVSAHKLRIIKVKKKQKNSTKLCSFQYLKLLNFRTTKHFKWHFLFIETSLKANNSHKILNNFDWPRITDLHLVSFRLIFNYYVKLCIIIKHYMSASFAESLYLSRGNIAKMRKI